MAIDPKVYDEVRSARAQLRELHGEVKVRALLKLVGRKTTSVIQVNREIEELEQAEKEAALEKSFDKGIREQLSKLGEVFADEKCQVLRQSLDFYKDSVDALQDLNSTLEEKQADSGRTIEELRQSVSNLEMDKLEQRGEIKALAQARDKAAEERSQTESKFAGLKVTVDQRSRELREERLKAKKLQEKLAEATALDKRRQEEIDRLKTDIKAVGVDLAAEKKTLSETQQTLIKAQSRVEELTDEIDKLKRRKSSSRTSAKTPAVDK